MRVNIDKVSDLTTYMINQLKNIENNRKMLIQDINNLNSCYRGRDADLIKEKYLGTLNDMNAITGTLEEYIRYFKWLSMSYGENLNKAKTNISSGEENSQMLMEDQNGGLLSQQIIGGLESSYMSDSLNSSKIDESSKKLLKITPATTGETLETQKTDFEQPKEVNLEYFFKSENN